MKKQTAGTVLPYEMLARLSAEEFAHLVINHAELNSKDTLILITQFENNVLTPIEKKEGTDSPRYQFFNNIKRILYMALQAEENINFWKNVAIRSKMGEEFHRSNAEIYYQELIKYKTIEETINAGTIDDYIEQVKKKNAQ